MTGIFLGVGMAYYTDEQLRQMGFRTVGRHVRVSDKASIYDCDQIDIGDYSRIDDFCVISGRVGIGKYCHITPMCLIAGGREGVFLSDFCTLSYGVKVFSQSDDYSGESMTNSMIPRKYKHEYFAAVTLGRQVIVGAGSTILPGVIVEEGCAIGANTLVNRSTLSWGIYVGVPARRLRDRKQDLLTLELAFLNEQS